MATTVSLYNHTVSRCAQGLNSASDEYRLILCTDATFDATDAILSDVVRTEVADGNGYTSGGEALANVVIENFETRNARFDADNVIWTAVGGSIIATHGILYNATDTDSPPFLFLNFGGTRTAFDGDPFAVTWSVDGILTWRVTP